MPFTFSHPAIIVPFLRRSRFFSTTGLIAGSLVPDFEYFFNLQKGTSHFSHTLAGLVLFDWPTGLMACFLFHFFVKFPLAVHLPLSWYQRVQPFLNLSWQKLFFRHFLALSFSLLFGALLHIGWDIVVHQTADLLAPLFVSPNASAPAVAEMKFYYLVWLLYSAAGALLLLVVFLNLPRQNAVPPPSNKAPYWMLVLGLTAVVSGVHMRGNPYYSVDDMAVIGIAYFLLFLLLVSAGWLRKIKH